MGHGYCLGPGYQVGGVALLMRASHTTTTTKLPKKWEVDPVTWDLWSSARFLHVRVAVDTEATSLHALCVYAVQRNPE